MHNKIDWRWVEDIVISKEHIRSSSAGKSGCGVALLKSLDDCLLMAKYLADPRTASVKKKIVDCDKGAVALEGGLRITGSSMVSNLIGSKHVHLFVVTIGSDLEDAASKLMNTDDQLHGYLLDRIGSFAVESLAEQLEKKLRREYRSRAMSVSMRYSPGYCDWPIEGQYDLAKSLDFSSAGVRLTENCMMVPRKSISGLVAIGPKDRFSAIKSPCSDCNMFKNCGYSRS